MRKLIICIAALAAGVLAWAQNPAETAGIGSDFVRVGEFLSISRNNVGASAFLFPYEGKLVTGLHSSVGDDQFLGGLRPVNSFYGRTDYNLVTYGWKGPVFFHTVEVGLKGDYGVSVPKEIFRILKTGTADSPYDLSSFRAFGNVYGEIACGYSLPISESITLGGRLKLLVGLNSADISARKFELTTTEDQYTVDLDADIDLTNRNRKVGTADGGYLDYTSLMGKGKLGIPSGLGLAMDLGVIWKPFQGFTLSASLLDIGGIAWYYGNAGKSTGTYTFDGLKEMSTDEFEEEKFAARLREVGNEVLAVIQPKAAKGVFKMKEIPMTARLDASYEMPFWSNLAAQASCMYSGYAFCAPYWEARGGASVSFPGICKVEVNAGGGAHGFVYGARGSVDFLSFRLYAGFENGAGGVIPYEDIPLKANNKFLSLGLMYLIK